MLDDDIQKHTRMNALIISLKFNPGHFSHLTANYRLFSEIGFIPYLYVHPGFRSMDQNNEYRYKTPGAGLKDLTTIDAAVFWFPSLRNIYEVIRMRFLRGAKVIYIYHEPFDSVRNYYDSGFRLKKILKICLIHFVNIPVIMLSHHIVLPSRKAAALYRDRYAVLNSSYSMIPLLFDDEAGGTLLPVYKTSFSYIGTIAADHAFDRFTGFVAHAIENRLLPGVEFLVATRNTIPGPEKKVFLSLLASGRLTILEGRPLMNDEINQCYSRSFLVWNAYNRSMQSGVLPKAYMFGAAVICRRGNTNEFFTENRTGISVEDTGNFEEIAKAAGIIWEEKESYLRQSRETFLDTYYYKNHSRRFLDLLQRKHEKKEQS